MENKVEKKVDNKVQKKRIRKTGPNEKIPVKEGGFSVIKPVLIGFLFTVVFVYLLFNGNFDPVFKMFFDKNRPTADMVNSNAAMSETVVTATQTLITLPPKVTPPPKAAPKAAPKDIKKPNEPGYKISGGKTSGGSKGWIKEIVTPGDGKTFPKKGDVVTMHYVGKFKDGKIFDSSRKRGQPFKTVIGVGRVIKGWDEGVPSMSLGESAILNIHPEYGYGIRGAGASIPPNSELVFEVELLEITPKSS